MRRWNAKGIRISLSKGRAKPAPEEASSVFRLGIVIPVISRVIIGARIRSREKAISKLGRRISSMVDKEKAKVENVVSAAEQTDIHSIIQRARALREKLEDAACAKVKFPEAGEKVEDAIKPVKPPKIEPLNILCIRAIARVLFDKDYTTGMVSGEGSEQRFRRSDLNIVLDKCVEQEGRLKVPADIVQSLTSGAKKVDLEIDTTRER